MKKFLEEYGFAILAAIVVILLIAMCTPVGNLIKLQITGIVESFAGKTEAKLASTDTNEISVVIKQLEDAGKFEITATSNSATDVFKVQYRVKDQNGNWNNWTDIGSLSTGDKEHKGEFTAKIENNNKIQVRVFDENKDKNAYFESNIIVYTGLVSATEKTLSGTSGGSGSSGSGSSGSSGGGSSDSEWKSFTLVKSGINVNYFPVFADGSAPTGVKFAIKSGATYAEVSNPTMATLQEAAAMGQLYYKGGAVQGVRTVNGLTWDNIYKDNSGGSSDYRASLSYDDLRDGIKAELLDGDTVVKIVSESTGTPGWKPKVNGVSLTTLWTTFNPGLGSVGFGGTDGCFWTNVVSHTDTAYIFDADDDDWNEQLFSQSGTAVLISHIFN